MQALQSDGRSALRRYWVGLLLAFYSVGGLLSLPQAAEPVYGLWVVRHQLTHPAQIDSLLQRALRWGITDLFVQVRGRGDAYYHSRFEPWAACVDSSYDPLQYLLDKASGTGLRIHAWVNVFYLWSRPDPPEDRRHLVNARPEWLLLPGGPSPSSRSLFPHPEGIYSSPLLPEVQKHILRLVDDLLDRYPLHGLHLDYIRFPEGQGDFNPRVRAMFRKKYVVDPLEFRFQRNAFEKRYGQIGYEVFTDLWIQFLSDGLSAFVQHLSRHVHARHSAIILSAAVKPDPERAHLKFFQNWEQWAQQGWLDWVIPMNYTASNREFERRLRRYVGLDLPQRVLVGVALYNKPLAQARHQVERVLDFPFRGVVLFSYDQLAGETPVFITGVKRPSNSGETK